MQGGSYTPSALQVDRPINAKAGFVVRLPVQPNHQSAERFLLGQIAKSQYRQLKNTGVNAYEGTATGQSHTGPAGFSPLPV